MYILRIPSAEFATTALAASAKAGYLGAVFLIARRLSPATEAELRDWWADLNDITGKQLLILLTGLKTAGNRNHIESDKLQAAVFADGVGITRSLRLDFKEQFEGLLSVAKPTPDAPHQDPFVERLIAPEGITEIRLALDISERQLPALLIRSNEDGREFLICLGDETNPFPPAKVISEIAKQLDDIQHKAKFSEHVNYRVRSNLVGQESSKIQAKPVNLTDPRRPILCDAVESTLNHLGFLLDGEYLNITNRRTFLKIPAEISIMPTPILPSTIAATPKPHYNVFISHATEDKDIFVRPLAAELKRLGLKVWYDEWSLTIGDSLRAKIDEGLASSDFGIVVLSHSFFAKGWATAELNGFFAREMRGKKVILPVRHGLTQEDVIKYSPLMADKLAAMTEKGVAAVAQQILAAIRPSTSLPPVATPAVAANKSVPAIPAEDLAFYNEQVELITEMFQLKNWGTLVYDMCLTPPRWDGKWTDDSERIIAEIRRAAWPKTLPALEAAVINLADSADSAYTILSEHVHYENGKYRGRAFYKDFGYNQHYAEDLKVFQVWIIKYTDSMTNFVKALNWFSDAVREKLDRTFFRKEGYFALSDSPQPAKYSEAEITAILKKNI